MDKITKPGFYAERTPGAITYFKFAQKHIAKGWWQGIWLGKGRGDMRAATRYSSRLEWTLLGGDADV